MNKLDRKLEKYAIPNLSLIMTLCYGAGFFISLVMPQIVPLLTLDTYKILHGQIWRLITWILIPGQSFEILSIIMLLFYYSIGHTLEQVWGDYLYNKYIFSGMLFTVLGSFIWLVLSQILISVTNSPTELADASAASAGAFTAFYIYMSVFLGFACTFPENRVYLLFIIPIKIKWLGIAYGIYFLYEVVAYTMYALRGNPVYFVFVVVILSSLMNFLVFFITSMIKRRGTPRARVKQAKRHHEFEKNMRSASPASGIAKHKCAICGRTEKDNAELQFRFCSKCNGNYEYCNDHLFNHKHVE